MSGLLKKVADSFKPLFENRKETPKRPRLDGPCYSEQEADYIHKVILTAMNEKAENEKDGTSLLSYVKKLHEEFTATQRGRETVKGIDTFGLLVEAARQINSMKKFGFDYREEIRDHGISYIYNRMEFYRKGEVLKNTSFTDNIEENTL